MQRRGNALKTYRDEIFQGYQPRSIYNRVVVLGTFRTRMNCDIVLCKLFIGCYSLEEPIHIPWLYVLEVEDSTSKLSNNDMRIIVQGVN